MYTAIVGDFNADLADLPAASDLVQRQGWIDLGDHPAWEAGPRPANTCFVAHSEGTRRDFVLVDPYLLPFLGGFSVSQEDTFPVHRPVQVAVPPCLQGCFLPAPPVTFGPGGAEP